MTAGDDRADLSLLPLAVDGGPPYIVDVDLLDRLQWAQELAPRRLLGLDLRVRCNDDRLARFLEAFLAAYPAPQPGESSTLAVLDVTEVGDQWVAYVNGARTAWSESRERMARTLLWDLNVSALAAPTDHLHVHAAVAARDGQALVMAGRSGAGKSTLVTALGAAGWTYLSDEVADIDRDRRVHGYPRPIALDPGSWPLLPPAVQRWPDAVPQLVTDLRLVLPTTFDSPLAGGSSHLRAIVLPEVVPGAPTSLEPLHPAEVLERLVPLTFNLQRLGREGFARLGAVVAAARGYRLTLDGIDAAPAVLQTLMS